MNVTISTNTTSSHSSVLVDLGLPSTPPNSPSGTFVARSLDSSLETGQSEFHSAAATSLTGRTGASRPSLVVDTASVLLGARFSQSPSYRVPRGNNVLREEDPAFPELINEENTEVAIYPVQDSIEEPHTNSLAALLDELLEGSFNPSRFFQVSTPTDCPDIRYIDIGTPQDLAAIKTALELFASLMTLVQQSRSLSRSTKALVSSWKRVLLDQQHQKTEVELWANRAQFTSSSMRKVLLDDLCVLQNKYLDLHQEAEVLSSELKTYRSSLEWYQKGKATFQDISNALYESTKRGMDESALRVVHRLNEKISDAAGYLGKAIGDIQYMEKQVDYYRKESNMLHILCEQVLHTPLSDCR